MSPRRSLGLCLVIALTGMAPRAFATKHKRKPGIRLMLGTNSLRLPALPEAAGPNGEINEPPPHLYTQSFQPKEISACLESICGPATQDINAGNLEAMRGTVPLSIQSLWNDQLKPSIENDLKLDHQTDILQLQRLRSLIERGVQPSATSPMHALAGWVIVMQWISGASSAWLQVDQTTGKYHVDDGAATDFILSLPPERQEPARIVYQRMLRPILASYSNLSVGDFMLRQSALVIRLKSRYPGMGFKQAEMKDGDDVQSKANLIKSKLGFFGQITITARSLGLAARMSKGDDLGPVESDDYADFANSMDYFAKLLTDREVFEAMMNVPFDIPEIFKQMKADGYLDREAAKLKPEEIEAKDKKILQTCETNFKTATQINSSIFRNRKALEMIDHVKSAAKRAVAPFASADSLSYLTTAIDKLTFVFPETNDILINRLKATIKDSTVSSQTGVQELQKGEDRDVDDLVAIMSATKYVTEKDKAPDDKSAMGDDNPKIQDVCEKLPISTVSDYSITSTGNINVSAFTSSFPEMGAAIVAHEIGHVVAARLRVLEPFDIGGDLIGDGANPVETFNVSRACVTNRNPFVMNPKRVDPPDDSTWSEEDWADHFSSLVMLDMQKSNDDWAGTRNMGCALISASSVQGEDGYTNGNTMEPGKDDPHSSGFLRVLMIAQDENQMTPACKPFLSYAAESKRELTCH